MGEWMGWMGGVEFPWTFNSKSPRGDRRADFFGQPLVSGHFGCLLTCASHQLPGTPARKQRCTIRYNTAARRKAAAAAVAGWGGGGGIQVVRAETWTAATMTIHKVHQTHQTNENPPRLLWPLIAVCPFAPCYFRRSASVCGIEKHHKTPATASYFDGDPRSRTNSFLGRLHGLLRRNHSWPLSPTDTIRASPSRRPILSRQGMTGNLHFPNNATLRAAVTKISTWRSCKVLVHDITQSS